MARANSELIDALRRTADRLEGGLHYDWGNPAACNCGHLARTVTELSQAELLGYARERQAEWGEIVVDSCPTSGMPIDWVIDRLVRLGLTHSDLARLEDLEHAEVLARIPLERRRRMRRNRREDVVLYLRTWAALLAEQLGPVTREADELRRRERALEAARARL
jgi:hypothetical protein